MTILFFCRLFYPHIGGVEKHVLRISQELTKMRHKIIIVTENHGEEEKENIQGIEIIRIPVGKNEKSKKFEIWKWIFQHRNLIEKADIIHCHDVFFWYLPFRFMYPTKPIYVTFHGYEGNNIPGPKSITMHKIAEKLTNGNICIGEFLTKWYKTKASLISYGATDTPKKTKQKKLEKTLHFLYIGRLEEEAGILEYIQALEILARDNIQTKLTVLGDGTQRKVAGNLAEKYKLDVQFKGFVENVEPYLEKCNFVFVSRYLGIIEAFAYNKYVFAVYNNKIKKDYLAMTPFKSWISIAKNPEELSREIKEIILNTKNQTKAIGYSFQWVKNQTWENLSDAYLRLWEKKNV